MLHIWLAEPNGNCACILEHFTNISWETIYSINTDKKSNIETYIESNVNIRSNISLNSSFEFIIESSPSNRINEISIPSDIHTPLVTSVTNESNRQNQKNVLKL